jgi:hypothetical protein
MNKIIILTFVLFTNFTIAQSTNNKLNKTDIEQLKTVYYKNLRINQDARVFSINKQRKTYVYKKFTDHKTDNETSFIKDSIKRDIFRKNILYDLKVKKTSHSQSLANTIGYRRVNSIFDKLEKEEKKKRLENENTQEIIIRNDKKKTKIKIKKEQLKSRIESRYELLIKKYAVPAKDKILTKKE